MTRILRKIVKYAEYLRISFLTMLAYRTRYFVGISSYLIYIAVNYFIWKAIYENRGLLEGYAFSQMMTYVTVGWVSRSFYFNRLDMEIAQKVIKGDLSLDLLKPVDFQWMQYARTFGESIFRLFLFTLPTCLVALLFFPIPLPAHWETYLWFSISTVNALFIFTTLNYLVGLCAIPLQNIEGLSYAKSNLLLFFSGLIIPFDFLPGIVRTVLYYLPFGGISYIPLSIYLEKFTPMELYGSIANQFIWILVLHFSGRLVFQYFTRKIVIQGG